MIATPVSSFRSLLGLTARLAACLSVGLGVSLGLGAGCHSKSTSEPATGSAAREDLEVAGSPADAAPVAESPLPPPPISDAAAATEVASPPPIAPLAAGVDFLDDAKLLYRIAACGQLRGEETPLPEGLAAAAPQRDRLAKIVERHCKKIHENLAKFRAQYFEKNRDWFDKVIPKDVPKTVVYPFGGGDLLSALVAFPDALEITTISLEQAGDPRRLRKLDINAIDRSLGALRAEIGGLISVGSNTSENLSSQQRGDLPGQVSSFLLGLVAAGHEPVAMRYFSLTDSGSIRYLEQADIAAMDAKGGKTLKHDWHSPNFSEAFQNVEIQFKTPGDVVPRVHRHIGWNLGDDYLAKNPQLLRHLEAKGKVTLLTKGASYLLWRGDFSKIRTYMLEHLAWMLSDSTGIPPVYARRAGMVQETYGNYNGAFLEGAQAGPTDESMIEMWLKQPRRRLPFRFGYVDKDKQAHVMVTRPKAR